MGKGQRRLHRDTANPAHRTDEGIENTARRQGDRRREFKTQRRT